MAVIIDNTFTSYEMTQEEELQGSILILSQVQVIQTRLAMHAEAKINLAFDPMHPEVYAQEESYLRGQMASLSTILDTSQIAVEELNLLQQNPNQS
jgi:hypothetical protein